MSINPVRKRRLIWITGMILVIGCAVGLMLYALRQNISLFYSPTQLIAGLAPEKQIIRAGGLVVNGSVSHDPKDLRVKFALTDQTKNIQVVYQGILPDLFREGQGVVVQGKWCKEHVFIATRVLAKHDEKYMPREVQAALKATDTLQKQKG